jgi:hypothetical protein
MNRRIADDKLACCFSWLIFKRRSATGIFSKDAIVLNACQKASSKVMLVLRPAITTDLCATCLPFRDWRGRRLRFISRFLLMLVLKPGRALIGGPHEGGFLSQCVRTIHRYVGCDIQIHRPAQVISRSPRKSRAAHTSQSVGYTRRLGRG